MSAYANSTFLDAFGSKQATPDQIATLANSNTLATAQAVLGELFATNGVPAVVQVAPDPFTVTVALVLNRANDPTSLLESSWGVRQAALADQAAVFAKYGADPATYNATLGAVEGIVGASAFQPPASAGFISSAADRTIWLTVNAAQFDALFETPLLTVKTGSGSSTYETVAWGGNLSLPNGIAANVGGLWFDMNVSPTNPAVLNTTGITLQPGPLGIGNGVATTVNATPASVAANYGFPLPADVPTAAIALVEGNVPVQAELFAAFNQYRESVGLTPVTQAEFRVMSGTNNPNGQTSSELALDISVAAGAVPHSTQLLYSTLGGTPFTAYQQVFFDFVNDPAVLTSSYSIGSQPTAHSPFQWAWQQLFVDGALSNVSVHIAAGDQGSSAAIANGVANATNSQAATFALAVGGTSIASLATAQADGTLASLVALALQDDPATVFGLVATGLKTLPSNLADVAPGDPATSLTSMFETVWQHLSVVLAHNGTLQSPFGENETGLGGVLTTLPVPSYQSAFGLNPTSSTGTGRGTPDVSALSDGDTRYAVLNASYVGDPTQPLVTGVGGTSAAAPLWASLTTQFNTIFHDQGLPNLGFYNDLLYIAADIAPGSFNDILLGNNVNSFYASLAHTQYFNTNTGTYMVPTGDGYTAGSGYDLASGLGTPNGMLLARALTAIAHSQISFESVPDLIDSNGHGGWTSGADQSLLFQTVSYSGADVGIDLGPDAFGFFSTASDSFSWTSRLAQQSLQPNFDPALVVLFDKQAQGSLSQSHLSSGESLSVSIDSSATQAVQAGLSSPFGFADFFSTDGGAVRAARPVAVAETADGHNDQTAIARLRQDGMDSLSITFYRVDDLNGAIGGLHPGDAGYQAALQNRAYHMTSGGTSIDGPGYGNYEQTGLSHVNAGDLVAMQLTNNSSGNTYLGFAQANETANGQHVGHLWNYGLNTWGWEDTYGGGDRDYNDLVVGLDFTSASGHGWLA